MRIMREVTEQNTDEVKVEEAIGAVSLIQFTLEVKGLLTPTRKNILELLRLELELAQAENSLGEVQIAIEA